MSEKICVVCKQDVSAKPRTKDAQGRYVCQECAAKAAKKAAAPAQGAAETRKKPAPGGFDVFANVPQPCPACAAPMKESAKICIHCGFNKETGQALKTRVSVDKSGKKKSKG